MVTQLSVIIDKMTDKTSQQTNDLMAKIDTLLDTEKQGLQLAREMFEFKHSKSQVP